MSAEWPSPLTKSTYLYISQNNLFLRFLILHPNIMIVFSTNLMHNFFVVIHLLHSSTCFEHCCAHLQEDNYINTSVVSSLSLGTQVTGGHKESDDTTRVLIQLSSWRWAQQCSKHVEECNKCIKIKNLCIKLVKKKELSFLNLFSKLVTL
jgi:hypothetical protein